MEYYATDKVTLLKIRNQDYFNKILSEKMQYI